MCTDATLIRCSLCKSVLETSSSRRFLRPCTSPMQGKISVQRYICATDFYFDENCSYYVCRSSCHWKLEKINDEVQSLSAELKANYNQSSHQNESGQGTNTVATSCTVFTIFMYSIQTYSTCETLKILHELANQICIFTCRQSYWNFTAKILRAS